MKHFDDLNFVLIKLHVIDVMMEDEDLTMTLLASLHPSYEIFMSPLSINKDFTTLEEGMSNLYSRELQT